MRVLFTQILGRPVVASAGDRVGAAADGVLRLVDGGLPRLTGILLRQEGRDLFVAASDLESLGEEVLRLRTRKLDTRSFERRPGEVLLGADIRGRAVLDVENARLVRVKDVAFEGAGSSWQVQAVISAAPASLGGLVRQLIGRQAPGGEEIPWTRVEPLVGHVPTLGRGLPFARLSALRAADIADIVESASHEEAEEILSAVQKDPELEADVFEELADEKQVEFLEDRSDQEASTVLANMNPDDAADLLTRLDQPRRLPILEALPSDQQAKVRALLGYGGDTAGGLMSNEFVALEEDLTVGDAINHIRRLPDEAHVLPVVFVLKDGALSGAVTVTHLLRCASKTTLSQVAEKDPVAVYADADVPSVAVEMADYNLLALPVVDDQGRILGVVTYDDLIEAVLPDEWRWRGGAQHAARPEDGEPEPGPPGS